jgi:DNA-binding CsgD family transcriptional regulator
MKKFDKKSLNLTRRQREVIRMHCQRGASIDEMAGWLKISRRAVLYRLQNARKKIKATGGEYLAPPAVANGMSAQPIPRKNRTFSASQILGSASGSALDVDHL